MAKHKSKLERFRDICEAVFFSDEKGLKSVPYQVAKEIGYPQSHTTSYMNELAKKKILIKDKNGIYSFPKFKSISDLEKADEKLKLSKYYSWNILDKLRKDLGGGEEHHHEASHKHKTTHVDHSKLKKDKEDLDDEISQILDMIDGFPLSFLIISKEDILRFLEQEIIKLKNATSHHELENIQFNIDLIIQILDDSAKVVK